MKLKQWFPLVLFAATLPLGNAQAETTKNIGSPLDNALGIADSCQASYDSNGALNIPCVNVSGVSYVVKLQAVDAGFALVSATPNSNVQGSACTAEYSVETGQLHVPCLDSALVLYADDTLSPKSFSRESKGHFAAESCLASGFDLPVKDTDPNDGKSWSVPSNYFGHYLNSMSGLHPGEDWNYGNQFDDLGKPVYAVADGTLEKVNNVAADKSDTLGLQLVLKHTGIFNIPQKDGYYKASIVNTVYSSYIHIKDSPFKSSQKGNCVRKGTILGYVMTPKDSTPHLHFEMGNSSKNPSGQWYPNDNGNGYYSSISQMVEDGFIEPSAFINANKAPTLSRTNFDGAGSLISPQNDVYGGNKDLDIMQPHSNTGTLSTVVFQFKPDSSNCHHVDIYSSPVISAFIQSKFWSDSALSTAFYGTLPMSVAASSRGYTVVAVTSAAPLTSSVTVQAYCRPASSDNLNKAITFLPDDDSSKAVSLGNNYYWAGTGSVITSLGTGTGKEDDIVPTFDTKKSLVSFQWQPSPSCPKLKLYPTNTTSLTFKEDNEVSLKLWNEPDSSWRRQACGNLPGSLPCTIFAPVPKASSYYIVKVKIVAGGGAMRAKCVQ